jgi:stearoyl-CoA desaturase (delta-9 desaturase)
MRFWLWMTTGMVTKQWVAIHRKHHRFSDQEGDPHSPHVYGIKRVLFKGAFLYNDASKDKIMVDTYGVGTPSDWLEFHLYQPHSRLGVGLLLLLSIFLFGWWGLLIWGIQMLWIPFWAAGVINGIGHWIGYRNGHTKDSSRNISPWGIVIGGEELHNNHHLEPASARLSKKWWEFDIGWMWLTIFRYLKLAKLTR